MKEFLPISQEDINARGWEQIDFLFISGDAYVDHPSFGPAVICRVLEAQGYKVALLCQPDWRKLKNFDAVGSVVTFTGTKHYISSMAVNGKSCKPGEAKVTAVAKSGKHPYHLIKTTGSSSTVYGWVDAADVKEVVPAIVKGSRVKVAKGAKTYNGGSLASYVYTTVYTVIQIDGSRVVIGINGVVTAAVNIKDLTLVG